MELLKNQLFLTLYHCQNQEDYLHFIAMRLTNPDDQNVIKRLFPDNLGDFSDMLPILDIGEALIVGDASLLPSRITIDEPQIKP
jgi:hypothetical protein